MSDSSRYAELKARGAKPEEVWRRATVDGLDEIARIRILRELFGLTLVEAKSVAIQARSGVGLDDYQERFTEGLEAALDSDELRAAAGEGGGVLLDLGCFRELGYESGASLAASRRPEPWPEQAKVVAYLRAGEMTTFCPGFEDDVFEQGTESGNSGMRSDGVYRWPDVLAYYVERYNVRLPDAAIAHMRENGWRPPQADS